MIRSILAGLATGSFCIILAASPLVAESLTTDTAKASPGNTKGRSAFKPAEKCLSDLRAFGNRMENEGYWLSSSNFGYVCSILNNVATNPTSYQNARPGCEIRILMASANILARNGRQNSCEDVLATARDLYELHVADMEGARVSIVDTPDWRRRQIAAARPVGPGVSLFRADALLGTEVRNLRNVVLGYVDDLLTSPQTGDVAYLVIAHLTVDPDASFGFSEEHVPVPWKDFKVVPDVNLLVLDTTKRVLEAAPTVSADQVATIGHFDQGYRRVDAYWTAHMSSKRRS